MNTNLVDSCGWLEYFVEGVHANFFASPLDDIDHLIIPSICIHEVFKKVLQEKGEDAALQIIAVMQRGNIVNLNSMLAVKSAKLRAQFKLPLADSIILATAKEYNATIWTQDDHFRKFKQVKFIEKSTQ